MQLITYSLPLNNKEHLNTIKEHNTGKYRGEIVKDKFLVVNYNQLLQYEDIMANYRPNEPYTTLTGPLRSKISKLWF